MFKKMKTGGNRVDSSAPEKKSRSGQDPNLEQERKDKIKYWEIWVELWSKWPWRFLRSALPPLNVGIPTSAVILCCCFLHFEATTGDLNRQHAGGVSSFPPLCRFFKSKQEKHYLLWWQRPRTLRPLWNIHSWTRTCSRGQNRGRER